MYPLLTAFVRHGKRPHQHYMAEQVLASPRHCHHPHFIRALSSPSRVILPMDVDAARSII